MSENTRASSAGSKADNAFENSSKNLEFFCEMEIWGEEPISSEDDEINCRFKDSCYVAKNKMGTCPCEFSER